MSKATFKMSVRIKRANVVFAEGFDPGVIATQQVSFELPEKYSPVLLMSRLHEEADKMMREHIEVDVVPVSIPENKE